jgi:CheY-like chemotaxis protein
MGDPVEPLIMWWKERKQRQAEAQRLRLDSRLAPTQPWTVLIIDDEPAEVQPLIEYLEGLGYRVPFARSGQRGLELIKNQKPDAIICDLEMQTLDGYDVLAAIAADPETRMLPFVLANAEWTTDNWSRPRNGRTADCHLPKPLNVLEVATFLRRICEGR